MVKIISNADELKTFLSKGIALVIFTNRDSELWNYTKRLLERLEEVNDEITFGLVDVKDMDIGENILKGYEKNVAIRRCVIKLYFQGRCILAQEGVFGTMDTDLYVLRRSIREVLRQRGFYIHI